MKDTADASLTPRRRPFRRFLLERAFWILGGFTLLALFVTPTVTSRLTQSPPYLLPTRIVFALGVLIWVSTFIACVRASFIPDERPSFIASFTFFLFLGFELLMLAIAARIP
jgi:hypothetical protein